MQAPGSGSGGDAPNGPRLWGRSTLISLVVTGGLLVAMLCMIDLGEVWRELANCDKGLAFLGLLAHYATYPVRGMRWRRSLNHLHTGAGSGRFGLLVFFYNFVDNLVPAKLGDVYGAHLARVNLGIRRSAALGSIVFLRMLDAWVVLGLATLASFAVFSDRLPDSVVWALIFGSIIAAVATAVIVVFFLMKRKTLPDHIPDTLRKRIESFQSGMWPKRREWLGMAFLTVVIWALETLWILLLLMAFGITPGFEELVFLTTIPLLASAFPFTPSGAGVVELTLYGCLRAVGVASPAAAGLTVLNRFIDYWLHIALGLLTWAMRDRLGLRTWREVPIEEPPTTNGLKPLREKAEPGATALNIRSVLLIRVSSVVDKVEHPQFFDPCYQLKYIQAGFERFDDVEVSVHDCWIRPKSVAELLEIAKAAKPDLVVVSASSFDVVVANDFAEGIGQWEDPPAIVGIGQGQYFNHDNPDNDSEKLYDAVLLGEPEEEFFKLFHRMRKDSADDDWRAEYRQKYDAGHKYKVEDLDGLPFPSYTTEELEAYRSIYPIRMAKRVIWGFLIAGRGCPYACTFCSEVMRVSVGTKMRVRSAASIADEMEHLARQGVNIISFQDDSFASSRKLVRSVCEELAARKNKIKWMARVRCDEVDYEILKMMRDAGCVFLGIGVEAGSQRIIDRIRKTYKPKPWPELCRQTFQWTRELGIGTNAYYVLGNPTETREEIEETIALGLELNADSIQVHFHTPYPGSADWKTYQDIFDEHDPTQMFHYAEPQFTMADVSVSELVELRSKFYRRYLFRPGFALRHLWHHKGFYFRNPDIFWTLLGIRKIMKSKSGDKSKKASKPSQEDIPAISRSTGARPKPRAKIDNKVG